MNRIKPFAKLQYNKTKDLSDKLALIIGSNEGIGYHTAKNLAFQNCKLALASRNIEKTKLAASEISKLTGNSDISCYKVDLGDFSSIDNFSQEFKNTAGNKLDYLILNAGVLNYNYKEIDGLEATVKVNHLGTMKLCLELLDLISNTPNSKVLFLSSFLHYSADLNMPIDLNTPPELYNGRQIYNKSKLMNAITARYIQTKVNDTTKVCSIDPGFVATNFTYQNLPKTAYGYSRYLIMSIIHKLLGRTPDQGSYTTMNAIMDDNLVPGGYYSNCELTEPSPLVRDMGLHIDLIEESLRLIK